jgi:AsmA protein
VKKILIISGVIIITFIIALTVFIKIYITPESVKAYLIPEAEKALKRKVQLGDIDISLLKGIQVRDFVIKEADEKTVFIACKDFILQYRLLPLLSRKVIIEELRIVSPVIRIVRDIEGTFNYKDIGQENGIREEGKEAGTKGLPISLQIDSIAVENAMFSFVDLKNELPDIKGAIEIDTGIKITDSSELFTQGSIELKLEEILMKDPPGKQVKEISAGITYKVSMAMKSKDIRIENADLKIQGIPLSIKGTIINLKTSPEIDINMSIPDVKTEDIEKITAQFADTGISQLSGNLSADLGITGMPKKPETIKIDTDITISKMGVVYKDIPVSVDGDASFDYKDNTLTIGKADFTIIEVPVSIQGSVINLDTEPGINISISIPSIETARIEKSITPIIDTRGLRLSGGSLSARLKVEGIPKKPDSLKTSGSIVFEEAGVTYNDLPAVFDGDLALKGRTIDIDTEIGINKNTVSLKGSVDNYFKNPDIRLNLYSDRLSIDELFPAKKEAEKAPPPPRKDETEPDPLDLNLSAKGEIKIKSAEYKNMLMSDFHAEYRFKNNRLEITKMDARAGNGSLNLSSVIDFSRTGYAYNLKSRLSSLQAEEIINTLFPKAKNTVFGIISLDLSLKGNGTLPDNIRKNLSGKGKFDIKNGRITNSRISENLALFLGIDKLRTIQVRKATGDINIKGGMARLKSIFTSDDIMVNPSGKIGLNESLDLAFDLKLSPSLTDMAMMNSGIASYIKDEKGWGSIPMKVSGTFSDPSYKIDLAKAGKRVIRKEADKMIDKILEKKDKKKQQELAPVKDLLKEILK